MAQSLTQTADLIRAGCALLGLWGVLNALQWLVDAPRWADGGPLGWDLHRHRRGPLAKSAWAATCFRPAGLRRVAAALLGASVALLLLPLSPLTPPLLIIVILAELTLARRGGSDGAGKMALVSATGLCLQVAGLLLDVQDLVLAGMVWTGGQLTIAYFAAGASKAMLAPWRNGQAIRGALSSYSSGHRWAAAALRNGKTATVLGWAVILAETAFPLALFAPLPVMLAALAAMLMLHLCIAFLMGLNSYPWAFLAAYPSAIMLHEWLGRTAGLG